MRHAQIAEVVTGRTMAELVAARDRAQADLVELRVDHVDHVDVAHALAGRQRPVIFTCRASWEGGRFGGSEEERLRILGEAISAGAEYVDVEWRADRRGLPKSQEGQIVLSHHDFTGMPADLDDRVRAMLSERPDILKVAVTAERLLDCVTLARATTFDLPHVAIAMGPAGQITRLCPARFGSLWTYGGQLKPGQTAPGQTTATELRDRYRVHSQSRSTDVYGVAGKPLGHSASPAMHNAAFRALGMDAVYVPFETADADEMLEVARAFSVRGLSVTAPLKTDAYERATSVDDIGRATGSINTLRIGPNAVQGVNFDVPGFLGPLAERQFVLAGMRAVVLGAGGAARTAAYALRMEGARVEISARRPGVASALADELGISAASFPPAPGWNLLVNTTPVGTWPDTEVAPLDRLHVRGDAVYDLIYNPEDTLLLRWARSAGAQAVGGLEMLVGQAERQFAWWTDRSAPVGLMAEAARAFVRERRDEQ